VQVAGAGGGALRGRGAPPEIINASNGQLHIFLSMKIDQPKTFTRLFTLKRQKGRIRQPIKVKN
jgi:hypothetical protein